MLIHTFTVWTILTGLPKPVSASTSSGSAKVHWNVTTLLDFGASQYTAQASISLRRFSNAPLRRHIHRLKRDLIAQPEHVIVSVAGFGPPESPRLQKDGEENSNAEVPLVRLRRNP